MAALPKLPVPKVSVPDDLPGRFSAWWDGRDYAPSDESGTDSSPTRSTAPASPRLTALQVLWGEGCFSPATRIVADRLVDGFGAVADNEDPAIGFSGVDPYSIRKLMGQLSCGPVISEWRDECEQHLAAEFSNFDVAKCDADRVNFKDASLDGVYTNESFTFADHKSGLVARLFKALKPGATWIAFDYVVLKEGARLQSAFASSWSEPQLPAPDLPAELAELAGLNVPHHGEDVTSEVVSATKTAFDGLGSNLGSAFAASLETVNKPVFLRELAWEAESWKWRLKALEAGLIEARLFRFQKPDDASD